MKQNGLKTKKDAVDFALRRTVLMDADRRGDPLARRDRVRLHQ